MKFKYHIMMLMATLIATICFLGMTSTIAQYYVKKHEMNLKRVQVEKFQMLLKEMIRRESNGQHEGCWGDNYTSYGKCQFQYSTFELYKAKYKMWKANYFNANDQVALMARMVQDGYGKEWTVYKSAYQTVYGTSPPERGVKILTV
jgi:hypothetical protein